MKRRAMPRLKRAKGEITVSLSEMSQEINLEDYLGREPTPEEKKRLQDRLDVLHKRHRMKVASASEKGFGLNR